MSIRRLAIHQKARCPKPKVFATSLRCLSMTSLIPERQWNGESFTTFTNKTALFHIIPYSFLPTKPIRIQTLILDSFDIQFCSTFPHHIRGSLRCWRSLRPPGQRSAGAIGALDGIGEGWSFTLVYIGLSWFTRHSYYSWRALIVDS